MPLEMGCDLELPVAEATKKATVGPFASEKDINLVPVTRNLRLGLMGFLMIVLRRLVPFFAYLAELVAFLQDVTPVDEKRVRKKEEKGRKRKK